MVSPIVGSEKQSEEMIHYLLQEFEGDITEDLAVQYFREVLPRAGQRGPAGQAQADAGGRPDKSSRETLQRIINEGTGGLICIIL